MGLGNFSPLLHKKTAAANSKRRIHLTFVNLIPRVIFHFFVMLIVRTKDYFSSLYIFCKTNNSALSEDLKATFFRNILWSEFSDHEYRTGQ